MAVDLSALKLSVREAVRGSARIFSELRAPWPRGGVNRDTYGLGEQRAHDVVRSAAQALDLEIAVDFAGNLYMTLPGIARSAPAWMTGSHLDSVPEGGNFDGAAGVVAGLAAVEAMQRMGAVPQRDVTVIGIRAEEASSWYQGDFDGHVGSRAALGQLQPGELQRATRIDNGRSMHEEMQATGCRPDEATPGRRAIEPARCHGFLELHIEQGPVLVERGLPVGIVTGIRGSARARNARCLGEYAHSGAVPHEYRKDAALATAEFCCRMDQAWSRAREQGQDLVFTVGRLFTDASAHSITKVPGEVNFSVDLRSQNAGTLHEMTALAQQIATDISERRGVTLALGTFNLSQPARMDEQLVESLSGGAAALGLRSMPLPSGAGHDAQDFAAAAIPTAMIFVRNDNGSHNPDEAMGMEDFTLGTQLLAWQLIQ